MAFINMGAGMSGKIGPSPDHEDLLEEEFKEPFYAWKKDPSPERMSGLLGQADPIIRRAIKTYAPGAEGSPTLYSKARLLAAQAVGGYDPSKAKLKTHLMYQLQGLRRAAVREGRIVSAPEQLLLDQKHLWDASNELTDRLGRRPSDSELADHTGLSLKRVAYTRTIRGSVPESTYSRSSGGEEGFEPAVVGQQGTRQKALQEFIYHDLDPVNQIIMEHTAGLHGKPVYQNKELARLLGITPGAVSQRKAIIQGKVDEAGGLGLL